MVIDNIIVLLKKKSLATGSFFETDKH